jgi:tetratricopeptide (TPR) repeat protein
MGVVHAVGDSGDYAGAIALAPELLASTGRHVWSLGTLGWLLGKMGQVETAGAVLDELAARSRHEYVAPFWPAGVAAAAGRLEEARVWAERALGQRDPMICLARFLSHWDGVRQAPWFEELFGPIWR